MGCRNPENKRLQYKFYPVSQEKKVIRLWNITWETFFLKNHAQDVVDKLFSYPFLKNQKSASSWIDSLKFYTVRFYCMAGWGLSKYIETKLQTICFYLILSFFKKNKRGLGTSLPAAFFHDFWRNLFPVLNSINRQNFTVWLSLFLKILGNMCIVILCQPGCDVKFKLNFYFQSRRFFCMTKKSRQKLEYLQHKKSF